MDGNDWGIPPKPGSGVRPRVVLDTDTFNEIDDQFALAYLVRCPDRVETEAIYAAPFVNSRAATAAEGMERSFRPSFIAVMASSKKSSGCSDEWVSPT